MPAWIAFLLMLSAGTTAAALGLERATRPYGFPTRWVWVCALLGSLALPGVLSSAAHWSAPIVTPAMARTAPPLSDVSSMEDGGLPASPARLAASRPQWLDGVVAAAWIASSGVAGVILLAGWWYGRRRRRSWRRASVAGMEVLVASDTGPATVGLLHPRIVVPEWLLTESAATVDLVIAHERSHVEARDPWLLAVGLGVAVLMPWNPLVWLQVYRLRLAIEIDCDRRVLRVGHAPRLYARTLVEVSTRAPRRLDLGALAAAPGSSSSIERRIMLMNKPRIHGWRASTAACALLSIGALAATLLLAPPAIPPAFASTDTAGTPAGLERYVGDYELLMTVWQVRLKDGRLTVGSDPLTLVSGQLFRIGKAGCCSPDGDSFVRFATDPSGRVVGAVLQQNGIATEAPRIDAQRVSAIDRWTSERVQGQTAEPGSEAALRQLISGIESGNPTYAELSPQVAGGTKALLSDLQATMKPWGALRSIEFQGVNHNGWDKYLVRFERGAASWELTLDSYGLIVGIGTHPLPN